MTVAFDNTFHIMRISNSIHFNVTYKSQIVFKNKSVDVFTMTP